MSSILHLLTRPPLCDEVYSFLASDTGLLLIITYAALWCYLQNTIHCAYLWKAKLTIKTRSTI